MKVYILGPGCPRCAATEKNVKRALDELKLEVELIKLEDPREYARWGVMFTPAVVVDDQVKTAGKIPTVEDVKSWLAG